MADAIAYGHAELQKSIELQDKLVASAGTPKKMPFVGPKAESVVKLGKLLSEGRNEFVVFDLETTAMKPENGYIVDIAALRVRDGQVVDRFESLVNPGRPIVGHQVHGIKTDDVANAPTAVGGARQFRELGGRDAGRRTQHRVRPAVRASTPAERPEVGADGRVRHARARLPALSRCRRPTSWPTSSASSSAATMPPPTAPCPTRRRPPSCSSTSPRASPSASTRCARTSPRDPPCSRELQPHRAGRPAGGHPPPPRHRLRRSWTPSPSRPSASSC